jgi:hypothetical protein
VLKVLGFIVETQFIKIQYKCDICNADIQNENLCRSGCYIKNPKLVIQVLCNLQDGTTKASLELKNERCITAFKISEEEQRMLKDYCLAHGSFMNPSGVQNPMYRSVLNVFKKFEIWQQMIFYCKPYSKATNEKKNRDTGYGNNTGYGETISRPTFLLKEKEKEIFLNGELTYPKQKIGFGEQG